MVSGSARKIVGSESVGSTEKKWQIPTGKDPEPGIVEPWPELSGGSENLNCRRIFGFAKKIVGSESVGSAANVLDPDGKKVECGSVQKEVCLLLKKKICWFTRKLFADLNFLPLGRISGSVLKVRIRAFGYGTYLPIWTERQKRLLVISNLK